MDSQMISGEAGCVAFQGTRRIAAGALRQIVLTVKHAAAAGAPAPIVIFDAHGHTVEVDLRGSDDEVLARLAADGQAAPAAAAEAPRGPGRPRLGVVGREVTLLPRHWDWLNSQPGGASVALRKLVEQARRDHEGRDRVRMAQETCYRFLSVIAGSLPGFEEAARALFGADATRFAAQLEAWPADVREHALRLAAPAFGTGESA